MWNSLSATVVSLLLAGCSTVDTGLLGSAPDAGRGGGGGGTQVGPDGGGDGGPAVCTPATELCNGVDDDCDGVVDGAAADVDCEGRVVNSVTFCDRAVCVPVKCNAGYAQCDGDPGNGCEPECECDDSCEDAGSAGGDGDGDGDGGGCRAGQGCFLDGWACESDADCTNLCHPIDLVCGCVDPLADGDGDGTPDCDDGCPADASATTRGACGCPATPAPAGTACTQLCGGASTCDAGGYCGDASACAPTGGSCTYQQYVSMVGHGYWFCTDARTQPDAAATCGSVGATLAQVDDMAENDFLDANIAGSVNPWIGGDDAMAEGTWRWPDGTVFYQGGSSVLYTRWEAGEPNDSSGEDCIQMYYESGNWNDSQCGNTAGYWCEIP